MNNLSLSQIFQNVFDSISFEGVGGNLEVYKIDSTGANLFYKNKINENNIEFITIDLLTEYFEKHFIIAERLFGRIITGERVIVGDPDGILEIRGNKMVITDRNGREVMWFGLYGTNPDKFGVKLENDTNQVVMDRDEGFYITRKDGNAWDRIIWLDTQGYIHAKGLKLHGRNSEIILDADEGLIDLRPLQGYLGQEIRLSIEDGITVTRANKNKIWLNADKGIAIDRYDGGTWTPVFYVDLDGNIVCNDITANKMIAKDLTIENDNGLITLRPDEGIKITRKDRQVEIGLNVDDGIYIDNDGDRKFWVDPNGILHAKDLIAESLLLVGSNGKILLDANERVLNLENFDMIIGSLEAQNVISTFFDTDFGAINDLTVNRLRTVRRDQLGLVDFIDIQDKYMRWVTAVATESGEQAEDSKGRPLYWVDSKKNRVTTEDTGIPVYLIDYNTERYEKLKMYFVGTGYESYPMMEWGVGSGNGESEKGYLYKEKGKMHVRYHTSAETGSGKRSLILGDNDLSLVSEMPSGTSTIKFINDGTIKIEHFSGSSISIGQNIEIRASGNLKLVGQRVDIN
ncbi:hypothetical protein EDM57_21050 [Brevibacillus gelatini]|uniref:Uncharacterized protein n=2 Tax=Brevibacillus gelatini TaxID=1655277 RepID=A0A3M8APU4_9BACL|nr:hypothetical protein EDM57_21050 [Brevibacillus gelatini]